MTSNEEYARRLVHEAFRAGWQAALAVQITNPRVFEVVDRCCEMWLAHAGDEAEVLGFVFRGREDLPQPADPAQPKRWTGPALVPEQPSAAPGPDGSRPGRRVRRLSPRHAS